MFRQSKTSRIKCWFNLNPDKTRYFPIWWNEGYCTLQPKEPSPPYLTLFVIAQRHHEFGTLSKYIEETT